jgi:hypothetical protein
MTNKTISAATGGDLAELWRERVAALIEGNYDRSYEIDDLIRAARPTDPAGLAVQLRLVLFKMDVEDSPDDCAMVKHVLDRLEALAGKEA